MLLFFYVLLYRSEVSLEAETGRRENKSSPIPWLDCGITCSSLSIITRGEKFMELQ